MSSSNRFDAFSHADNASGEHSSEDSHIDYLRVVAQGTAGGLRTYRTYLMSSSNRFEVFSRAFKHQGSTTLKAHMLTISG